MAHNCPARRLPTRSGKDGGKDEEKHEKHGQPQLSPVKPAQLQVVLYSAAANERLFEQLFEITECFGCVVSH
jgi:hypothetical protein